METSEEKKIKRRNNKFIVDKEKIEREQIEKNVDNNLYPRLNDPNFALKIATKKEYSDSKLDLKIYTNIEDFKEHADKVCFKDYEIAQHQKFVKNFISFYTPYNSLLLYHGLGSGKTCSAIGVSEQIRRYMKQMNYNKRIIVVASPNVQKNFRLQLFDESKLKEVNGVFKLNNCTGDKILKEINPTNNKGLTKGEITKLINSLINKKYVFMGYTQFSNYIDKKLEVDRKSKNKEKLKKQLLKKTFDNRFLIIDEVHNIRLSNDNKLKKISSGLFYIATHSTNFKMLLLSATPLYNNYKEIIWLLNLMNANDKRGLIYRNEIFDDDGNFLIDEDGDEIGKKALMHKANGYVSYVRGENPYSFPFRIFPMNFNISKSTKNSSFEYPLYTMNGKRNNSKIEHIDIYLTGLGEYQEAVYDKIISEITDKTDETDETDEDILDSVEMEAIGYTKLTEPIQSLNVVYPSLKEIENTSAKELVGTKGLENVFTYNENIRVSKPYMTDFKYKDGILKKYGRIFSPDKIGMYSSKIREICVNIEKSNGISLVYSQYIDAGVIPMALALEEMGFTRYGNTKNLINDEERKKYKIKNNNLTYMMITGKKSLSSDWLEDFKVITDDKNKDGKDIKVVIITRTGSEGLDFSNLRSVHIMEPWYNMNRIEQIIGRAIRFCSHKKLDFENRNCSIYMYGSLSSDKTKETADLYVYRLAEKKSVKIGNVTRILKEVSVDCVLNISQTNFSFSNMKGLKVEQKLFNGDSIMLEVGDKPYSTMCDYKETCEYSCKSVFKDGIKELNMDNVDDINYSTYNEEFLSSNSSMIIQKIKRMFESKYVYLKEELISDIKLTTNYSTEEIIYALNEIIEDGSEIFVDKYKRLGKIVNIGEMYMFQPLELINKEISVFDRSIPVDYKNDKIKLVLDDNFVSEKKSVKDKIESDVIDDKVYNELVENYTKYYDYEVNESVYKFALNEMINKLNLDRHILKNILIEHLLDHLSFSDKKKLIKYIYNIEITHELEIIIKKYFDKKFVNNKILNGIILQNEDKYELLLRKNNDSKVYFIKAKQGEINNLLPQIKEKFLYDDKMIKEKFGEKIGVLINFKNKSLKKNELIFKIKNLTQQRTTGARCDQYTKTDKIQLMNELTPKLNIDGIIEEYTNSNMKKIPLDSCYYIEFLFRYLETTLKDKKMFLSPEESILNKLERRIKL